VEASAWRAPAGLGRRPAPLLLRLRSDDQLVALFRLGNEEAFRAIHDRYRARLVAYARQMLAGSGPDAEDALQDVFIRAYHALRADDRPVTLRAWLYRVAHNRCVDQLRKAGGGVQAVELFENVRALDDPEVEIQRREDLRRLIDDMRRLPEQQRSALLMREMEGLSYAELADALQVTVPAVKSLLVRARMGLVDAQTARDTACGDIRADLAGAHDRGVRASGRARKHLRECDGCRDYRAALRGVERGVAALAPTPTPWGLLAKLFGIGGSGAAGATAGGGAAAGGGALVGGAATAKVAAIVCCAALVGGGAMTVTDRGSAPAKSKSSPAESAGRATSGARTLPHQHQQQLSTAATARRTGAATASAPKSAPRRAHHAQIAPASVTVPSYAGAADGGDEAIRSAQADAGGLLGPGDEQTFTPATQSHAPTGPTQGPSATGTASGIQGFPSDQKPPQGAGATPAQGPGGMTPPAP
jgi:RNA polymerase sigma factor (sigma-70 family)